MAAPLPSRTQNSSGSIPRPPAPRPTEAGAPGRPGVDLSLVVGRRNGAPEPPVVDEPFAIAFRGYDRQQVDERMEDLKGRVGRLRIRAEAAEAELKVALSRLKDVDTGPPAGAESGFGVRVEKVLRLAEDEADAIRREAEREAAAELTRAGERAKRLVADAEKAAQQQRDAADREVERLAGIRDEVRAQMATLHRLLADGLGAKVEGAAAAKAARD